MRLSLFNMTLGGFLERRDTGAVNISAELDRYMRAGRMTAEQADDEMERLTGCRFGDATTCKCPDCKHNGYQP